jgi:carboxylesterase
MGSLLTLYLGAQHPELAGLIVMAPAIKVQNRLLPLALVLRFFYDYNPFDDVGDNPGDPEAAARAWSYDQTALQAAAQLYLLQRQVRRTLPSIHQPLLTFLGRRDPKVHPQAGQILADGVSSTDTELIWLENSGHNVLNDGERESVWELSHKWLATRAARDPYSRPQH